MLEEEPQTSEEKSFGLGSMKSIIVLEVFSGKLAVNFHSCSCDFKFLAVLHTLLFSHMAITHVHI